MNGAVQFRISWWLYFVQIGGGVILILCRVVNSLQVKVFFTPLYSVDLKSVLLRMGDKCCDAHFTLFQIQNYSSR